MIKQVQDFIEEFYKLHGPFKDVLDVGSLDVNGSVHEVFIRLGHEGGFTGMDMRDGKGVDVVLNGHDIDKNWKKPSFDLVLCCDTLEHDDRFWVTVEQMRKVLKPGGWLLITVPSFFHGRHDHPSDYWRFLDTSLKDFMLQGYEDAVVVTGAWSEGANNDRPDEIFGYGRKPNGRKKA